ncbi:hypothetical protein SB757_28075, partial [Pseudomonas sp. SIMBA_065]
MSYTHQLVAAGPATPHTHLRQMAAFKTPNKLAVGTMRLSMVDTPGAPAGENIVVEVCLRFITLKHQMFFHSPRPHSLR